MIVKHCLSHFQTFHNLSIVTMNQKQKEKRKYLEMMMLMIYDDNNTGQLLSLTMSLFGIKVGQL